MTDRLRLIWRDLVLWGSAALVVRCGYAWWVVRTFGLEQESDSAYLFRLAGSLAAGRGFTLGNDRIFNQSVGYPAFLAVFFRGLGPSESLVLALNIVLGVLAVLLTYVLTCQLVRWKGPEPVPHGISWRLVAWLAGGLATFFPDNLLYLPFASAENLLIPLMLILVWSAVAEWRSPWLGGAVTGAVAAAVLSVKANAILLCPFILFAWVAGRMQPTKRTAAAALVGVCCLLPWTYLNYRDSGGHIVPFSAIAGEVFLDGTNPQARGTPTNVLDLPADESAGLDKIQQDRAKLRKAVGYIEADPVWYMKLVARKGILAWSPVRDYSYEDRGQYRFFGPVASRWVPTLYNVLLFVGIAASLVGCRWFRPESRVLWAGLIVAPWLLQMIFVAYSRYRFPFLCCLVPFAAWGWCWIEAHATPRDLIS